MNRSRFSPVRQRTLVLSALLALLTTLAALASPPPPIAPQPAPLMPTAGWSCDDFPCEDDLAGWQSRIGVPPGFAVEYVGRWPGQPMQMTYGPDGRLYATVLENGTRAGAVYALGADGQVERVSPAFVSPVGLAFQPGTGALFVSSRLTPTRGGAVWRVDVGTGQAEVLRADLPCCRTSIDQQPQGLAFGPDGALYLGVGALTDRGEPTDPQRYRYATPQPYEASILRIDPQTGEAEVYAGGLRDPYDLAFAADGRLYATDNGTASGIGDRVLRVSQGAHYGWPFYRTRGCEDCPPTDYSLPLQPDLLPLRPYTLPRGLTVYDGQSFPANYAQSLFVAFWNGVPGGQRVVRIEPDALPTDAERLRQYVPEPFVTGLVRPVDVVVAPDGALVVTDFVYGLIWRVVWTGNLPTPTPAPVIFATNTPQP